METTKMVAGLLEKVDAAIEAASLKLPFGSLGEFKMTDGPQSRWEDSDWESIKMTSRTRLGITKVSWCATYSYGASTSVDLYCKNNQILGVSIRHDSCGGHWCRLSASRGRVREVCVDKHRSSRCWEDDGVIGFLDERCDRVADAFRALTALTVI